MTIHQLHDARTYQIIGAAMEVHRIDFVCFGEVIVEVKATSLTGPAGRHKC